MDPINVRLGEKDYAIKPLTMRAAKSWREKMFAALEDNGLGRIIESVDKSESVAAMFGSIRSILMSFPEMALDLLIEFSPELAEHRERIETEGYDAEIIAAFVEVLQTAIPFTAMVKAVANIRGLSGMRT